MYRRYSDGILEVITGPMFSGKTEELLKRINTLHYANIKTLIVKPKFDVRFGEDVIMSRNSIKVTAINIQTGQDLLDLVEKSGAVKAVAIDEVHFFKEDLIDAIDEITSRKIRVIVAGLDQDYLRRPFGIMPNLLAMAEEVTKLKAVCIKCKLDASCSYRIAKIDDLNYLGDQDAYEARCRKCHIQGEKNKLENI